MCVSFSKFFIVFTILQVLHCAILIFHINEWFSPYSRSNSVCVPFSIFYFKFLAKFHVLPDDFLISWVGQFSCHIPGPVVCISHFSHISMFLAIFQVIQCLCLFFHVYLFVCLFFHHIPGPTLCISHFSCFSMFLFHISCSKLCVSQVPPFSIFFAKFQS